MKEQWSGIPGFPWYEASTRGRIRVLYRRVRGGGIRPYIKPRVLHPTPNSVGRPVAVLFQDGVRFGTQTGRVILTTFRGPAKDGQHCRHLDGNVMNNSIINLAWGSAKDNANDREKHGNTARGQKNGNYKLADTQIRALRREASDMMPSGRMPRGGYVRLAVKYGVNRSCARQIAIGQQRKA